VHPVRAFSAEKEQREEFSPVVDVTVVKRQRGLIERRRSILSFCVWIAARPITISILVLTIKIK